MGMCKRFLYKQNKIISSHCFDVRNEQMLEVSKASPLIKPFCTLSIHHDPTAGPKTLPVTPALQHLKAQTEAAKESSWILLPRAAQSWGPAGRCAPGKRATQTWRQPPCISTSESKEEGEMETSLSCRVLEMRSCAFDEVAFLLFHIFST